MTPTLILACASCQRIPPVAVMGMACTCGGFVGLCRLVPALQLTGEGKKDPIEEGREIADVVCRRHGDPDEMTWLFGYQFDALGAYIDHLRAAASTQDDGDFARISGGAR